jgi:hypothetical protein
MENITNRKTFTSWYDGKTYEFLYAHASGEIWRRYTPGDESDSELINVVDEGPSKVTDQQLIDYFESRRK